jgi:nitrate reductase NapA
MGEVIIKLTRREFVKTNAIAATATTAGITIPGIQAAFAKSDDVIH